MDIREQLRQHRKDNRLILGSLGVLMLVLTAIYYLIQHSRDLPAEVINSRVILFVLWYVDVVLALAFVFVLGRSLYKLFVERSRFLGSKFKFKLVATNVGLSLIPVLLLYLFATQLLQGSLDRLFSTDVKQALEKGSRVVDAMNNRIERTASRDATRVSHQIRNLDLQDLRRRPAVNRQLQQMLDELGEDYLAVYENGEFIHAVVNPQSGLDDLEEPPRSFLQEALDKGRAIQVRELPGNRGRLVFAGVSSRSPDGTVSRVVVTGSFVDPLIASQGDLFIRAFQGYRQLELQMNEIRASYLLTMLLVTLIILSAMLWIGLRLTHRVTAPIQALAEGTRQVSQGDLAYRVDVEADDELGVLVESFNKMTAELQRSKNLLEESYQELVKTNRQVAEERARVGAVLENLAAGVISVDAEGHVLTCNDAALQLLEHRDVDIIGRPIHEVWSDGELRKLVGLFDSEDGVGRRREEVRLLLNGDWKTFEAKVTAMRDSAGRLTGQVMVLEDLTELIKAQQLAAWNDAARRIAHEIKNPLTPIKLSAERLLKKHRQGNPDLGDALEEAVEIIGREVDSMKSMVDEFSRFARMPRPQPSAVDIQRLVDDVLQLYRDVKPGVEISSRVDPELPDPVVDGEQIRGALINLLDNAIEATEPPGRVHVGVSQRDGSLRIRIADTGHGVSPETREQLFLPHFSTKRRGSGLGLAIVHRIVSDHRGTIQVEDNRPTGTVFTLEIPLA